MIEAIFLSSADPSRASCRCPRESWPPTPSTTPWSSPPQARFPFKPGAVLLCVLHEVRAVTRTEGECQERGVLILGISTGSLPCGHTVQSALESWGESCVGIDGNCALFLPVNVCCRRSRGEAQPGNPYPPGKVRLSIQCCFALHLQQLQATWCLLALIEAIFLS